MPAYVASKVQGISPRTCTLPTTQGTYPVYSQRIRDPIWYSVQARRFVVAHSVADPQQLFYDYRRNYRQIQKSWKSVSGPLLLKDSN